MEACKWCGGVIIKDYDVWYCSRKCANEHYSHQAEEDRARKAAWDALTPEQKKAYEEQRSLESRRRVAEWEVQKAEDKRAWFWSTLIFSIVLVIWIGIRKLLGYW